MTKVWGVGTVRGIRAAVALAVVLGLLAGCGKKGAPSPPGPPDKIIYPRSYPTH